MATGGSAQMRGFATGVGSKADIGTQWPKGQVAGVPQAMHAVFLPPVASCEQTAADPTLV